MTNMRPKIMTVQEFEKVAERNWMPVSLFDDRPAWMHGIPQERLAHVLASGSFIDQRLIELGDVTCSGVVGGIDVYRYDPKDVSRGYPFNKDHYLVVNNPKTNESLIVIGPLRDDEHWLDKLPSIEPTIEVFEFRGSITFTQSDDV